MNLDDGGGFLDWLNEDALADDWVLFLANGTLWAVKVIADVFDTVDDALVYMLVMLVAGFMVRVVAEVLCDDGI